MPGILVKVQAGAWAFVPHPLPPKLVLPWQLLEQNSKAERTLGELSGALKSLPNARMLIAPFVRREAVLSSRIEGTRCSLSDLLVYEAAKEAQRPSGDVEEVANYVVALNHGLAKLERLPVSLRLLKQVHRILMSGAHGGGKAPGEFRAVQNWIGAPGSGVEGAVFVPPPVDEMLQALSDLEKYIHARCELPLLVKLALVHYQFECIHPFLDGNGRVGRLLVTLLLHEWKLLPEPALYLSAYFERHRQAYYDRLAEVSKKGAWEEWIVFFLQAVEAQSADAVKRASALLNLQKRYRDMLALQRSSQVLLRVLDDLFMFPATSIGESARRLGITARTAVLNIEKLAEAGIVREVTGKRRNRVYVAGEILRIISR